MNAYVKNEKGTEFNLMAVATLLDEEIVRLSHLFDSEWESWQSAYETYVKVYRANRGSKPLTESSREARALYWTAFEKAIDSSFAQTRKGA